MISKRLLTSCRQTSHRLYYSYTHPPPPSQFTIPESQILSAASKHIPTHGFTITSLALGAKEVGYIDASVNMFPKGAWSLVHWHMVQQREGLGGRWKERASLDRKEEGGSEGRRKKIMGIGAKVKELTWLRLLGNKEIVHRWQEALALSAIPSNIPASLHELSLLSDEIWFQAGDVSVDSSWYTKRAALGTIYATTEVFMTTDKSPRFIETREFLDRRFEDNRKLGGIVGSVRQWVGFNARATINLARSRGVPI